MAGASLSQLSGAQILVAQAARRVIGPLLILVELGMLSAVRLRFNWGDRLAE